MGELTPVVAIDGRSIGDGNAGTMTARLTGAFGGLTATEGERLVD